MEGKRSHGPQANAVDAVDGAAGAPAQRPTAAKPNGPAPSRRK